MNHHNPSNQPPNAKKSRAAAALASGSTVKAAAKEAGVHQRTVFVWLRDPAFKAAVNKIRARLVDRTLGKLSAAATKSVTALEALLDNPDGNIQARAATGILDRLVAYREHTDLVARLDELEAKMGGGGTS
jgi:transposase-like protein